MNDFHYKIFRSAFAAALVVALAAPVWAESSDAEGLAQMLQRLSARIDELDQEIADLKAAAPIVQSGTFPMVARNTRGLRDGSACPEASTGDAYRGTVNGRIEFTRAYSHTPEVVLALRDAAIVRETRLELSVTAIDERGFNYTFATYCTTIIYDADAVWIAHGRTSP
ncbi:MAG: H-type lectin domain-containing protein [Rhodobacter sp.]|nr:H-type lectin domain-containing protein [Rhodobacter sp.]